MKQEFHPFTETLNENYKKMLLLCYVGCSQNYQAKPTENSNKQQYI